MQRLQDGAQSDHTASPSVMAGVMPGKATRSEQLPAVKGPELAPIPSSGPIPASHDESHTGSQVSKIDWNGKAGKFTLADEQGMENKSLYDVFLAKFKEQLARLPFKGERYEEILARRDHLHATGTEDGIAAAAQIDQELWRARTYAIIETLKVETSKRYQPTATTTYCNVYAYDLVTALGGYLPRVWWLEQYLAPLKKGALQVVSEPVYREAQAAAKVAGNAATPVAMGKIAAIWLETTEELNANGLAAWFNRWGQAFGWRRTADMQAAQDAANGGKIVVISAAKKDTAPGHISVVIAEDFTVGGTHKAPVATTIDPKTKKAVPSGMAAPLQSQAGTYNHKYADQMGAHWWDASDMKQDLAPTLDQNGDAKPLVDAQTGKPVDAGNFWIYDGKEQASVIKPDAAPAKSTDDKPTKPAGPPKTP